ncbi:MAG TPA: response regulator transcription factor [Terracidiphilus sp.]|jgi:DNA-binding NarL/FixJ family response regulator|nr:response regulator transcription factor [Terracidiphilus sp.]
MSSIRDNKPIRIGVLSDEPLRLEGLTGIFEDLPGEGYAPLSPVFGNLDALISDRTLTFLLVDLNAFPSGVGIVEAICRHRPEMRLIVIGPEGNEKLIMDLVLAGARACLDLKASPRTVRQAIEEVTSGSIWAPRRLLSKLIDQLLQASDASLTNGPPHLTKRELQVLELILTAQSNREIARQLGIEECTVQAHVGRLMRKTGADNRINLLMRASDPSLLQSNGIKDRRKGERRQNLAFVPPLVTDK